ncbi:MAG: hypothetical protein N2C12_05590, partial [Planctomycetales bacterium]
MATRFFIPLIVAASTTMMWTGCSKPPTPKATQAKPDDGLGQKSAKVEQKTTKQSETKPELRNLKKSFVQTIPETLVEFEMVLVPGDDSQGIKPFYIGKNEVSWAEFAPWALCEDITEKKCILEIENELRPSLPHDVQSIYRGWGRAEQPALG